MNNLKNKITASVFSVLMMGSSCLSTGYAMRIPAEPKNSASWPRPSAFKPSDKGSYSIIRTEKPPRPPRSERKEERRRPLKSPGCPGAPHCSSALCGPWI